MTDLRFIQEEVAKKTATIQELLLSVQTLVASISSSSSTEQQEPEEQKVDEQPEPQPEPQAKEEPKRPEAPIFGDINDLKRIFPDEERAFPNDKQYRAFRDWEMFNSPRTDDLTAVNEFRAKEINEGRGYGSLWFYSISPRMIQKMTFPEMYEWLGRAGIKRTNKLYQHYQAILDQKYGKVFDETTVKNAIRGMFNSDKHDNAFVDDWLTSKIYSSVQAPSHVKKGRNIHQFIAIFKPILMTNSYFKSIIESTYEPFHYKCSRSRELDMMFHYLISKFDPFIETLIDTKEREERKAARARREAEEKQKREEEHKTRKRFDDDFKKTWSDLWTEQEVIDDMFSNFGDTLKRENRKRQEKRDAKDEEWFKEHFKDTGEYEEFNAWRNEFKSQSARDKRREQREQRSKKNQGQSSYDKYYRNSDQQRSRNRSSNHSSQSSKETEFFDMMNKASTLKEAKKVYRQLSSKYHPDKGGDKETMQAVNNAWERIQRFKR